MNIPFAKMHGAGNDFILVDDRALTFPAGNRASLAALMARRTGIGAEGLLLVQPSATADLRMRFFNPDGGEADMCGNGARCLARFAHDLGAAPATMRIETAAGPVRAEVLGERVRLHLPAPKDWRLRRTLTLDGAQIAYHFVNTGVPHAVVEVADLAGTDVARLGAGLRRHADFAPAGTNVNFIACEAPRTVGVRTFERGVEAETLACGTGLTASALIASRLGRVTAPARVLPASGDELEVGFTLTPDGARDVTLLGPAVYVFRGSTAAP